MGTQRSILSFLESNRNQTVELTKIRLTNIALGLSSGRSDSFRNACVYQRRMEVGQIDSAKIRLDQKESFSQRARASQL